MESQNIYFGSFLASFCFTESGQEPCWEIWSDAAGEGSPTAQTLQPLLREWTRTLEGREIAAPLQRERTALLLSKSWSASAGFSSPTLRSPKGTPALVIQSDVIATPGRFQRLLTHEWTHLVHGTHRPAENAGVREIAALMAEQLAFGTNSALTATDLREPESGLLSDSSIHFTEVTQGAGTSLQTAPSTAAAAISPQGKAPPANSVALYGHRSAFAAYALRHCGGRELFSALLENSFDEALRIANARARTLEVCSDFKTLFRAFERARLAPSPVSESRFVEIHSYAIPVRSQRMALPPWSAGLYALPSKGCASNDLRVSAGACLAIREE